MRRGMVATGLAAMVLAAATSGCRLPEEGGTDAVTALYGPPPAEAPVSATAAEPDGFAGDAEGFDDADAMRYDAEDAEGRNP